MFYLIRFLLDIFNYYILIFLPFIKSINYTYENYNYSLLIYVRN